MMDIHLPQWAWIILLVVAYVALTQWVLPRFGIAT